MWTLSPSFFDPAVDSGPFGAGRDGTKAFYANFFALRKEHAFLQVGTHQVDLISDDTASGVLLHQVVDWRPGKGMERCHGLLLRHLQED